jgi:hypothetical protein
LPIPWDTQASLHKAGVRQLAPGQHAIFWTDEVWNGALARMLKEWLSKADTLKPLYTIVIDKNVGTDKTVLDHRDMDALVKRLDFPSKKRPMARLSAAKAAANHSPITLTARF